MPEYLHKCQNPQCQHEWELEYSIKEDPPTTCPECLQVTAKRLISLGGKGVVKVTGRELLNKIQSESKSLEQAAAKNENLYANLCGEDKYQKFQQRIDKNKNR